MDKQTKNMTPTKLRLILLGSIVLLLGLSIISFWFFRVQLVNFAQQVHDDSAAATVSSSDLSRLQELKFDLNNESVAVTRAKSIVADSKYYSYQDQIISDITSYASKSGVSITSFAFTSDSAQGSVAATAPVKPVGPAVPAGLKTISTTITLKSPVNFQALMNFVHALEVNLTHMQLTGISIAKGSGKDDVTVNPLTVEVYTR